MKTLADLAHAVTGILRSKAMLHSMAKDDAGAELAKKCASTWINITISSTIMVMTLKAKSVQVIDVIATQIMGIADKARNDAVGET